MARFDVRIIRNGEVGKEEELVSVYAVRLDEGEHEIVFPESFEGKPVTHIGYGEEYCEGEFRYHDWHHPAQGGDYYPEHYEISSHSLGIPSTVTRIYIPKSVKRVGYDAFSGFEKPGAIEIDPENTHIAVNGKGKVYTK